MFLANYSDGLTNLHLPDDDPVVPRAAGRSASFMAVKPSQSFHVVVAARGRERPGHPARARHGHPDQRRLLRPAQRDLPLHEGRRGAGGGAVPAPDRRSSSSSPTGTMHSGAWTPSRSISSSPTCTGRATLRGRSGRPAEAGPPVEAQGTAEPWSANARPRHGTQGLHRDACWCRCCGPRATRSSGSTATSTERCTFGDGMRRRCRRSRKDVRDVEPGDLRGLRRRHPPGGALERPARQPRSRADLRDQPRAPRCGWPSWRRRPACRASCSPPRAATTARRATTS